MTDRRLVSGNAISALPRLIEALEKSAGDGAEVLNHLLGAVVADEFGGAVEENNVIIAAPLLANLLRAARGERVAMGQLLFNAHAPDMRNVRAALGKVGS